METPLETDAGAAPAAPDADATGVVMATAVLAWLLGIATSIVFRFRTCRP
jgi:hypothetical protein